MNIFKLVYVLYKIGLFCPTGLYSLIRALRSCGINLMALLHFAGKYYCDNPALVDGEEEICYGELSNQVEGLSKALKEKYNLDAGKRAGLLCRNSAAQIKSIFALSRLGVDIYLLNAEISGNQFNRLVDLYEFDFLIYDYELSSLVEGSHYSRDRLLAYHDQLPAVNNLNREEGKNIRLKRTSMCKIVLLTSGTTGISKTAVHRPSLFNYLNPFLTMTTRLALLERNNAYIATPLYHGYGIAVLLLFTALGKRVIISRRFDAEESCRLIRKHRVEVITVVPLMIHKMLRTRPEDLKSLRCIASGGAELSPRLVEEVFNKLGNVLYNLYGTSEAGLNMIATPLDLRYSPNTIGRKIKGVKLKVLDGSKREVEAGRVGQFCIRNKWSMGNRDRSWIETGDLGYRDINGYYFLCGRTDDMIVSAGENVYPIEVEKILKNHPKVEEAAVLGVSDEIFGQRLKAFVLPVKNTDITKEELLIWLRTKASRFQIPRDIEFLDSMPYTSLGKLDKRQLKQRISTLKEDSL